MTLNYTGDRRKRGPGHVFRGTLCQGAADRMPADKPQRASPEQTQPREPEFRLIHQQHDFATGRPLVFHRAGTGGTPAQQSLVPMPFGYVLGDPHVETKAAEYA